MNIYATTENTHLPSTYVRCRSLAGTEKQGADRGANVTTQHEMLC